MSKVQTNNKEKEDQNQGLKITILDDDDDDISPQESKTAADLDNEEKERQQSAKDNNNNNNQDKPNEEDIKGMKLSGPGEVQYYLPPGSCEYAQELLESMEMLTEQDVLDFVHQQDQQQQETEEVEEEEEEEHEKNTPLTTTKTSEKTTATTTTTTTEMKNQTHKGLGGLGQQKNRRKKKKKKEILLHESLVDAYHKRRDEVLELAWKVWFTSPPEAYVDDDGRLVAAAAVSSSDQDNNNHEDNNNMPPLPPLPDRHLNNNNNNNNNNLPGDNNPNNNNINVNNDANNDAAAAIMNNNINNNNLPPLLMGNNNMNMNMNNNNNIPFPFDQEEEERRWTQQEEGEAELAIARAVARYQRQNIPPSSYVLLKVQPTLPRQRASLTFRRICFAVLAVVTAFICIMLQTLPLFPRDTNPDPLFDKLLYELVQVRHFPIHAESCPRLHRTSPTSTTKSKFLLFSFSSSSSPSWWWWPNVDNNTIGSLLSLSSITRFVEQLVEDNNNNNNNKQRNKRLDCGDGVLHIPTKSVLVDSFFESSTKGEATFWEPYVLGVNVSWFLKCNPPIVSPGTTTNTATSNSKNNNNNATNNNNNNNHRHSCQIQSLKDSCHATQEDKYSTTAASYDDSATTTTTTTTTTGEGNVLLQRGDDHISGRQEEEKSCFRGIHDNIVTDRQVGDALRLGAELIQEGYDHFDIHYDTKKLADRLPSLLQTIRNQLRDTYQLRGDQLQPVAFRVNAVGPLDGNGVALRGSHASHTSNYLMRILNRQNYIRWIEKKKRHNELARYSLPWPTKLKPFRDPCHLMADMEADPRFNYHTSVFLSNGAGRDFRGGVTLYVDDHPSNTNPRRKIQRGVTIDGSRGRLVVSTGGLENRRCRLPTREGVRAALQIWWKCGDPPPPPPPADDDHEEDDTSSNSSGCNET